MVLPWSQEQLSSEAQAQKEDIEYKRKHNGISKQGAQARRVASGLSAVGQIIQYFGSCSAIAGILLHCESENGVREYELDWKQVECFFQ